jgi:hypothetical protein
MQTAHLSPRVADLARDLRNVFPRSPRAKLGPYVVGARTLDKCRAALLGWEGEYVFGSLLDGYFFGFLRLSADAFRVTVASGASDDEMVAWIAANGVRHSPEKIVAWNNRMREMRLSDLPVEAQMYLEDYIPAHVPAGAVVYRWFDVYDLEEGRM